MGEKTRATSKTPESKGENSSSQTKKTNFSLSINSPVDQILFLQRTVGNRAIQGLLKSGVIKAKLTVGQPGDVYEQEADRVAERVMLMKEGSLEGGRGKSFFKPSFTTQDKIQRQEKEPEPEELKETRRTLPHEFDLRLDWFEMSRPFFTRGAESMLYLDDRMYLSVGNVWTHNRDFFFNFGLGDKLSADAANFFTPFTIDSALKRDFPTSSELFERNADITSFVVSPTLFTFDVDDILGTLRLPFLKIFGVKQPNPYVPVQRKCAECEQEEELQRKEEHHLSVPAQARPFNHSTEKRKTSDLDQYIPSLGHGRQPLPPSVRAFFEPRFGQDFSGVRVHTDSQANESAKSVNALAYTVGRDIVFGTGQYAPETTSGKKLMAHELTHVVQQSNGKSAIRRKIQFDSPNYIRENPIQRILSGQPAGGVTTPTVNSNQPVDLKQARELFFKAIEPQEMSYDPSTKECAFDDFDVKVSANVIIFTEPDGKKWTMNFPGSDIKGTSACNKKKNVPVIMTGKPSSEAVGKWIEKNEQEHVDDLKKLYDKYLEPHFKWVLSLKGKGDDDKKCLENLMSALGNKGALVVKDFSKDWGESVQKRDKDGKHTLKNDIKIDEDCSKVEIESSKR